MGQIVIINAMLNLMLAPLVMFTFGPKYPQCYAASAGIFVFAVLGAYVGVKLLRKETSEARKGAKVKVKHA